jgi:hypothetical protein
MLKINAGKGKHASIPTGIEACPGQHIRGDWTKRAARIAPGKSLECSPAAACQSMLKIKEAKRDKEDRHN